eukprot:1747186-Rhodomonas_salina.2
MKLTVREMQLTVREMQLTVRKKKWSVPGLDTDGFAVALLCGHQQLCLCAPTPMSASLLDMAWLLPKMASFPV